MAVREWQADFRNFTAMSKLHDRGTLNLDSNRRWPCKVSGLHGAAPVVEQDRREFIWIRTCWQHLLRVVPQASEFFGPIWLAELVTAC